MADYFLELPHTINQISVVKTELIFKIVWTRKAKLKQLFKLLAIIFNFQVYRYVSTHLATL